jgi:hypothetical protein
MSSFTYLIDQSISAFIDSGDSSPYSQNHLSGCILSQFNRVDIFMSYHVLSNSHSLCRAIDMVSTIRIEFCWKTEKMAV